MLRIPLHADDMVLTLAPPWPGWGLAAQVAVLAVMGLLPLALIVGLYRYELRLVARLTASLLLGLRSCGLLILWVLAGLHPVVGYVERHETPSRVLVAVDCSSSMAMADPQRTEAEQTALANVLGVEPAAAPRLTRHEIARRLLDDDGLQLLARLRQRHRVELVGFHETLWEVNAETAKGLTPATDPMGGAAATNLGLPLRRALQEAAAPSSQLLGIVLLSDGQHNQGPPPVEWLSEMRRRDLPIYAIGIGSQVPPADLAVVDLQAPRQIYKDAEA
ncbi:MAG: VWA domain-containing protein, partial [Gemmataceae bacterium]|nr:VWA domain-containing protein [Gemmataceae bacterium]